MKKQNGQPVGVQFMRLMFTAILSANLLTGCAKNEALGYTYEKKSANQESKETSTKKKYQARKNKQPIHPPKNDSSNDLSEELEDILKLSYEMKLYTKASNQDSSVKIQYPVFSGNKAEEINAMIMTKVLDCAQLNPLYFSDPDNTKMTVEYQSSVTLQNSKIVSIVFWGTFDTSLSQFPTSTIFSFNIDLKSLNLISLTDLYTTNEKFETVFFEKAFFSTNPVTSYSEKEFPEMLELQTVKYKSINPFIYSDSMVYFLKPEGIVLSMPSVHASGSDHFEAELLYGDIQDYYLPEQIYWKE